VKKKIYKKEGQLYYSVSITAKMLGTSPGKVRKLMGDGTLEWNQSRLNGRILVSAESVKRYLLSQRPE
jgi:hypothetical protein